MRYTAENIKIGEPGEDTSDGYKLVSWDFHVDGSYIDTHVNNVFAYQSGGDIHKVIRAGLKRAAGAYEVNVLKYVEL